MRAIKTMDELEARYPREPSDISLEKVMDRLTPKYRDWIMASRFCVLSTVGPEGTDASPRGDDGPVVRELDPKPLALPDWRGSDRLDSLKNIIRDPRVSLMFMVHGSANVVRVNGTAILTDDAALLAAFERGGRQPATVLVITIGELYFQCAKAIMRSRIWTSDEDAAYVPSAGDFIKEYKESHDAAAYDAGYADYAKDKLW